MLVTDIVNETALPRAESFGTNTVIEADDEAVEIIDSVYALIKI